MQALTAAQACELLFYDDESGALRWLVAIETETFYAAVGDFAGWIDGQGYVVKESVMTKTRVVLVRPERDYPDRSRMGDRGDPKGSPPGPHRSLSKIEKPKLQELLRMAEGLPAEERQQILDHLALKAQVTDPASIRDLEMWSGAIYEALQEALGASAGAMGGPMVIRRAVAVPSVWKPVDVFMKASKLSDLQVRERQSVYRLLAQLLVDHARFVAKRSGAPLSAKLVGNCAGSISGVFEGAFPGYLQAGLAPIVARRLAAGVASS